MTGFLLFVLGFFIAIIIVIAGSRTSLGALMLPKDIESAARKASGGREIVNAEMELPGRYSLMVSGSAGPSRMLAFRTADIAVSVGFQDVPIPESGSFALHRTLRPGATGGGPSASETLDHVSRMIEETLQAKGYRPTGEDGPPQLLVRYYAASDQSIDVRDLDQLHGFAPKSENPEKEPLTTTIRQGSLVIDISAGDTGQFLWRAAALADVRLEEELAKRLARIDLAIGAMLKHFPPKQGT